MDALLFYLAFIIIVLILAVKNKYLLLLITITGLIFWQFNLTWLGLIFFLIALLYIIAKPTKKLVNETWDEFSNANPKSLEKEVRGYASFSSKKLAEGITKKEGTKYQLTDPVQLQKGTKNFWEELKKIFS